MEYPTEGCYTPDFVESDCTIDLPDDTRFSGEQSPRSRFLIGGTNSWCGGSPTAVEMGRSPESFHGSYASYFTDSWNSNANSLSSMYDSDFSVTPRSGILGSGCSARDNTPQGSRNTSKSSLMSPLDREYPYTSPLSCKPPGRNILLSEEANGTAINNTNRNLEEPKKPERLSTINQGTNKCPPKNSLLGRKNIQIVDIGRCGGKIKLFNSSGAPSETKKTQREYSLYAQSNVQKPSPNKTKKNVVGHVPGYGPVYAREVPVPSISKVSSAGVKLPLINTKATKGDHGGETRETTKNGLNKETIDILKSRARDRLLNYNVDEKAPRKMGRQNAKHR